MDDLVAYCQLGEAGVLQAAIAHAQFETIHPFNDGNGRVGRVLIYRILRDRRAIGDVAAPISPVLVRKKNAYIQGLSEFRFGEPSSWLQFFCETVVESVQQTRDLGQRLQDLANQWNDRLGHVRKDAAARKLTSLLLSKPVIDAQGVSSALGVSDRAALNALRTIEDLGIVREQSLRKARRGKPAKVFAASQVFDILDAQIGG